MAEDSRYEALRKRLIGKAAVRDAFDPKALLAEVVDEAGEIDRSSQIRLLSSLRQMSTETKGAEGIAWLMRPAARQKALENLPPDEVEVKEDLPITAALAGRGDYAPAALTALVNGPADGETLLDRVVTLERAGPKAPGHAHLLQLRSRLNRLRQAERTDTLLGGDFIGRAHEIERIEYWIDHPQTEPPLKTVYIEGLAGIGKSFLMEHVMRMVRDRDELILVRLDFDRAALQVGERGTLFDEISRQIGDALPKEAAKLRELRLEFAERQTTAAGTTSEAPVPHDLIDAMVQAVGESGRLLFLLDTLEKLHGQGATFVERVLRDLGRFVESGSVAASVVSAGRGPIFPEGHPLLIERLLLTHLEADICERILERRGIPAERRRLIIEHSRGNPLRLTLFAHAMQDRDLPVEELVSAVDTAHVYRMIGSRVPEDTRAIAHLGLIVPRINADILAEVVGPALGLSLTPEGAEKRLETLLEQQDWLVRQHPDGSVSHRPEVRREILPMLYSDDPDLAEDINRRTVDYFEGERPALQLYHALQLTRYGDPIPDIEPLIAQRLSDELLEELPRAAREAVLHARGERSSVADEEEAAPPEEPRAKSARPPRRKADREAPVWIQVNPSSPTGRALLVDAPREPAEADPRAMKDLRVMLEKGERREASHIVKQADIPPLDPSSENGLILLAHQWRTGHWSIASQILALLSGEVLERWMSEDPALIGRVLLELWAEFRFDRLVRRMRDPAFGELALSAVRSSGRASLRGGALEFALAAANIDGLEKLFPEPVRAAGIIAPFADVYLPDAAFVMRREASAMRSELGLEFLPLEALQEDLPAAECATAVAPLNPYAEPMRALVAEMQAVEAGDLPGDLVALRPHLDEATRLFCPDVKGVDGAQQRLSDWPEDMVDTLRSIGMLADWAEGYSFFHSVTDLPAIAHAAERWRRVSAGFWDYGRCRPEGWMSEFTHDPQSEARARRMLDEPGSEELALRALTFWADPAAENPTAGRRMLRHRLGKRYERISDHMTLQERLDRLQSSGVSGVFAAPLAVLAERSVPPEQLLGDDEE